MRRAGSSIAVVLLLAGTGGAAPPDEVWTFDNLSKIGGHNVTVLGHPKVIDTPIGKAVQFNGVDDALFLDVHPLAGAQTFTWESVFRPEGGPFEQRWFHLAEQDPKTGEDTQNRMLYEVRIAEGNWYLDSFYQMGSAHATLMNKQKVHPVGPWYHVAAVYDGKTFTNYVNGVPDNSVSVQLPPQGPGHTSVGVRINKVYYFKGSVHSARFTRRALSTGEFIKVPAQ